MKTGWPQIFMLFLLVWAQIKAWVRSGQPQIPKADLEGYVKDSGKRSLIGILALVMVIALVGIARHGGCSGWGLQLYVVAMLVQVAHSMWEIEHVPLGYVPKFSYIRTTVWDVIEQAALLWGGFYF